MTDLGQSQGTVTLTNEQFQELMRVQQGGQQQGGQGVQSQSNVSSQDVLAAMYRELEENRKSIEALKAQNAAQQERHIDTVLEREALIPSISNAEISIGSLSGHAAVEVRRSSNSAPVSGLKINFYTSLFGAKHLVGSAFTNQDGIADFNSAEHSVASIGGSLSSGYIAAFDGDQRYKPFEAAKGTNIAGMLRV